MGKISQKTKKACHIILLCVLGFIMGQTLNGQAKIYEKYTDTKPIRAKVALKEKVKFYSDKELTDCIKTKSAYHFTFTIEDMDEKTVYGYYKEDGKKVYAWAPLKDYIYDPDYKDKYAFVKEAMPVYGDSAGSYRTGTIKKYSGLIAIGKQGSYMQVLYTHDKKYEIGWVLKSTYKELRLLYDGREKQIIADGTYSFVPDYSRVNLKESYKIKYAGQEAFYIYQDDQYLTAKKDSYKTYFEEKNKEEKDAQLWIITRKGKYYTIHNVLTGQYLFAGDTGDFWLGEGETGEGKQWRLTRKGKNVKDFTVFCQYDPKWGAKKYGTGDCTQMASSACGVLAVTNAVYALNGQFIDPMELADYAVEKHYRIPGCGTDSSFMKAAAKKFGEKYGFKYERATESMTELKKHIQNGGTAIAYVPGHYVAVVDYNKKKKKFLVLDSHALPRRQTTPFGDWVSWQRLENGNLETSMIYLYKAVK